MAIIQRILQSDPVAFVVVLGLLIFFHEGGHFLVAKLFRVRVLVFSFGFGKRLFGFQAGGTDYRVSLIPLGGYVRMAGDNPEENQPANPDEFLSKPKWQRFLILFAGPFMNLLIAVGIFAMVDMIGVEQRIVSPVIGEVTAGDPAQKSGLQVGDRITAVNGEAINDFDDLRLAISMHAGTALRVEYLRNGQKLTTTLTPRKEQTDFGPVGRAGIRPLEEPIVGRVNPGSLAAKAGLHSGDRIVAINGAPIRQYSEFDNAIINSKGAALALDLQRGASTVHAVLAAAPLKDNDPYRGFLPPTTIRKFGFAAAIGDSVEQNWKMLKLAGSALRRLFTAQGSVKELSGPLQIAHISGEMLRRGWIATVLLMSMISLQLGVMNLLPIPVLDGGHIMVLLIEGVVRRDLSIRVKERIQQLGFALLAALMIVVIYNDILGEITRFKRG
jgi:regulator of sigma E protease